MTAGRRAPTSAAASAARWGLAGLAALAVLAASPALAKTRAVLGRDAGPRLVQALRPFRSGHPVGGGWVLGDISIAPTEVRLALDRGPVHATLFLARELPAGAEEAPAVVLVGSTPSFEAWIVGANGAPPPAGAVTAAKALVGKLRAGDDGAFFQLLTDATRSGPDRPSRRDAPSAATAASPGSAADAPPPVTPPAPTAPMTAGMLGALILLTWGAWWARRSPPLAPAGGPFRWIWPVVLGAAAWALRVELGPLSLLHENGHGVSYLARIFGLEAPLRPMGGVTALHQLLAPLLPPSFDSVLGVHAASGALQAPLVYGLTRALGGRVHPAALAGAVMAVLPLAVRVAGSEDAFTPGTTFVLAGTWAFIAGVRRGVGPWLMAGLALVAVGGYLRPLLFTAAAPLVLGALLLPREAPAATGGHALRRSTQPRWLWLAGAVVGYWVIAAPEVPYLLQSLRTGTPMTAGWWNGRGLRNWALLDPQVTPPWVPGVAVAGLVAAVWRGPAPRRRAALWLGAITLWMSYWLTSDNGHPASLRYAVSYAWAVAALVGLAVDALPAGARRWALWVAAALVVATPARFAPFMGHEFAQQAELRFQREAVLPVLRAAGPGTTLVTPWPTVGGVRGTTLAVAVGPPGLRIADLDALPSLLADRGRRGRGARGALFWYRSLSCYLRISDGAERGPVPYHPACAAVDAVGGWEPVVTRALKPESDADWIELGDGHTPVVVGLFRWTAGPKASR